MSDLGGAVLTLLSLVALGLGGYLLALLLVGKRAEEEPLDLAVATLLAMTGLGVGLGLALGALGELRIGLALPVLLIVALGLWMWNRHSLFLARTLLARTWARLREHPALSLLTLHAVGAEALRGLFRPPLSWDSLMYHLTLTGNWVQRHDLAPIFGAYPMTYYGYVPANGSVWLWWWMAPSHSELYANLAFLPQWALLALATGAVARRLGARRSWPLASFLVGMTPTVVRFAATQYVDIFTAACLVAATAFGLRWLRRAERGGAGDAALAGIGLGLAAGAKVLGLLYGGGLAAALVLLAVWRSTGPIAPRARRRVLQVALALALAISLGGFFYLRNIAHGVGPLALACEGVPHAPIPGLPRLPRPNSVAALPYRMLVEGQLLRAFLGTADIHSPFVDLGLGPQTFLLLLAIPALVLLPRGPGSRRREGAVVLSQVLFEIAVWTTVPYSASGHVLANVRYLLPAVGLAAAGGIAAAEGWLGRLAKRGTEAVENPLGLLGLLTLALLVQDVLQLHTTIPDGFRSAIGAADVLAAALLFSPALRLRCRRHLRPLLAAALLLALAAVPAFARFRTADRARAFSEEFTAHVVSTARYAGAWAWLDQHGGLGTVDVVSAPDTFFVYPAMGPRLERRAIYANVNARDLHEAALYPLCQPRTDFSADAWLVNLYREGVRWLDLSRTPPFPLPREAEWAAAHPELFILRYSDSNNRIYELLPLPAPPGQRYPV